MNAGSNPAETAGENRDGSYALAKESRVGALVTFAGTVGGMALLGLLADVDLSTLPGWAATAGVYALSQVAGVVSAYVKANR